MQLAGAYSAERAAALSGVPKSTVYYWAREGHLVPSISRSSLMRWSYTDLLALRTIYWLRQPKKSFDAAIPATSMKKVRHALAELRRLSLELFEAESRLPLLAVTRDGSVLLDAPAMPLQTIEGQLVASDWVDVIKPFEVIEGGRGPHLQRPRPLLRILPRKLGGAPHIEETRIETEGLFALNARGFSVAQIIRLYPALDPAAVEESLDLEQQLQHNLSIKRAA